MADANTAAQADNVLQTHTTGSTHSTFCWNVALRTPFYESALAFEGPSPDFCRNHVEPAPSPIFDRQGAGTQKPCLAA